MPKNIPAFVNIAVKSRTGIKNYSESDRMRHCEAWRKSGLSMNQYCQRHGASVSSLSSWLSQSLNKQKKSCAEQTVASSSSTVLATQSVDIILANGIQLRFGEVVNMSSVLKLIAGLSSCN